MKSTPIEKGALYIVATPIGNLKDITIRALDILNQVDVLLAEDTRSVQVLLKAYQIQNKTVVSYHSHNEKERVDYVLGLLSSSSVALVSEAGTPLICDPGILLVQKLIEHQYKIIPIPGVTAFTTLLPITGFDLKDFYFAGFLSTKKNKRLEQLKTLQQLNSVLIIYESPHRIQDLMEQVNEVFDAKTPMAIGRELTKQYETIYRGSVSDLAQRVKEEINFVIKGEFCIIINNNTA